VLLSEDNAKELALALTKRLDEKHLIDGKLNAPLQFRFKGISSKLNLYFKQSKYKSRV
jgi:hypothetical protein